MENTREGTPSAYLAQDRSTEISQVSNNDHFAVLQMLKRLRVERLVAAEVSVDRTNQFTNYVMPSEEETSC